MSTSNYLNGYDEVIAITQNTINSQFALLCPEDNSGPIFQEFSIMDPNDPHGWQGLVVTSMAPPTVNVLQADGTLIQQQMSMTLYLSTGTLQYYDYGDEASLPIDNWTITFQVPLGNINISSSDDLSSLSPTQEAEDQINEYLSSELFSVAALFTMFEDANIASGTVTASTTLEPNQQTALLSYLAQYLTALQSSGNPFILGYPVISTNPSSTMPDLPTFAPISMEFSDTPYPYNYSQSVNGNEDAITKGLATINYLLMTDSGTAPTDASRFTFDLNWVTTNDVQGVYAIQNDLFRTGYVEQLILPMLKSAMGVPDSVTWINSSNSDGEHTYTIDYNEYPYANDNDGKGKIIGTDSWVLNIYEELHNETYMQVTVSKGDTVVLNGTGFFYQRADIYEYPIGITMHDAWTEVKQPYTFTITLSVSESGSLQGVFDLQSETQQTDDWENVLYEAYDWLLGWVADTMSGMTADMASTFSSFETAAMNTVTSQATSALQGFNNMILLPNGDVFSYANLTQDDQQNILINTTYRNNS